MIVMGSCRHPLPTKSTSVRLEPGVPHYETLNHNDVADYVFEFNNKNSYVLNFYTHNVKLEDVSVDLMVSATE